MEKKRSFKNKNIIIIAVLVFIVAVTCIVSYVVKFFLPSKEIMQLTEYYPVPEDRIMIVMQNEVEEEYGLYIDKVAYVDYQLVKAKMNKRFYWDKNEKVLSYTTPNEVIKVELDSNEYKVAKSNVSENYPIVKIHEEKVYIAIDFVVKFSNVKFNVYENPNRMVVHYKWGENFLYANVKKETQLRLEPDVKSDILVQLVPGEKLRIDESQEYPKGFYKAMTESGVEGYVKSNRLKGNYYEALESDFKEEVYSHIEKNGKINLVWHQVFKQEDNEGLLGLLNNTKGVTVVSPTWFTVKDNEGNLSSIASEKYVTRAHKAGVEVWGLCSDFDKDMKIGEVLAYTSRRERLVKELLSAAIKYELDGINIDFEYIPVDQGEDFIQFIRELSVKCRLNEITLSIDNYVPSASSAHYDREEQGIVADYVITMAYDEHYPGLGKSGSVSSLGFVTEAVNNVLAVVPPERAIIALPFYTRIWKEEPKGKGNDVKVSSVAKGMNGADTVLKDNGVKAEWDSETGQYYAQYEDGGATYKVWLEEETSLEEKMKVVMEQDVAGVAFWKLGLQRDSIWDVALKYLK